MRGCGLKFIDVQLDLVTNMSSSMRGCGLKSFNPFHIKNRAESSSMRGCGLKLGWIFNPANWAFVILYARMWIEISNAHRGCCLCSVILYARMWIEIRTTSVTTVIIPSHPLCEDVDWNILHSRNTINCLMSSSMRGCGLKWTSLL